MCAGSVLDSALLNRGFENGGGEYGGERSRSFPSVPKLDVDKILTNLKVIIDHDSKPGRSSSNLGKGRCPDLESLNAASF